MRGHYNKIVQETNEIIKHIRVTRGCSGFGEKTYLIAFLIYYYNCKTTLDLGVFTGGSLFPQAKMHNKYTGGMVYGVDPFTRPDMELYDNPSPVFLAYQKEVLDAFDFDELHQNILNSTKNFGFDKNVTFLRQRSDQAINYFIENNIIFDLMFIDGNHDKDPALNDVKMYIPRLANNGFFILDDITWGTLVPAYNYAKENLMFLYEGSGFAIFQKTTVENVQVKELKQFMNSLKYDK
jgi:hypothetical protein